MWIYVCLIWKAGDLKIEFFIPMSCVCFRVCKNRIGEEDCFVMLKRCTGKEGLLFIFRYWSGFSWLLDWMRVMSWNEVWDSQVYGLPMALAMSTSYADQLMFYCEWLSLTSSPKLCLSFHFLFLNINIWKICCHKYFLILFNVNIWNIIYHTMSTFRSMFFLIKMIWVVSFMSVNLNCSNGFTNNFSSVQNYTPTAASLTSSANVREFKFEFIYLLYKYKPQWKPEKKKKDQCPTIIIFLFFTPFYYLF